MPTSAGPAGRIAFLCLSGILAAAASQPDAPLDRPYTQRNLKPAVLEDRYHAIAMGRAPLSYLFPAPCGSQDSTICGAGARLSFSDSAGGRLRVRPIGGAEYRYLDNSNAAIEAGALAEGSLGPAAFLVDARIFAENADGNRTYDREGKDKQSGETSGSVGFDSYARYRGNLSLDVSFGRFTVARDAVHWGPGLFGNLVFQQDAVPFNHLKYTAALGPVRIVSLYGELTVGPDYLDDLSSRKRTMFAHRYELSLGRNVLLAMSEQIILYEHEAPFLFTPVFPLFIAKGFMHERANNGNLAWDLTWRVGAARLYGEFLLDDMESASSLFTKDYVQNKWGALAGAHAAKEWRGVEAGLIAEYARLEPRVYAHFLPNTAQAANLGYPLGNPMGPNSQSAIARAYARHRCGGYASGQIALLWKGAGPGSDLNEPAPESLFAPKEFLDGVDGPDVVFTPCMAWELRSFGVFLSADLGSRTSVIAGMRAAY